ncbi:bah [Symbiodinium natans]|uniref:Bah protein n=1 Tax=Symbiodinium natans TaxID=878477 RepID=A0A812UR75_9DINO|nr:bah [Symbiodinium natans]
MPWRDLLCGTDSILSSFLQSKSCKTGCFSGVRHRLMVKLLRQSADLTPRSLKTLRLICDQPVPKVMLRQDVSVVTDVLRLSSRTGDTLSEVSLEVEWLLPKAAAREARQPEKPEKVTPFSWLPGSGCMAASDQCPRDFQRIVLYLHGGAYLLCTPKSLRGITFNVAAALQAAVCVPDYRRPPEHPIPGPMEDAIAVYRHLLVTMPGKDIILAGDSAGGGIAAAMMHRLKDLELPLPSCCILISPWTDLGHDGMRNATMSNEERDFLPRDLVEWCAVLTRGDLHHDDWRHSPVHAPGSLEKVCPTLVVYGEDELLSGQIVHFGSVWRDKGASITMIPVQGGVHAPLLLQHVWEPAADAFKELSRFAEVHCTKV